MDTQDESKVTQLRSQQKPDFDIAQEIFRAYDIRGIVDVTLTVSAVTEIGYAVGTKVLENNEHRIVIGRDGRLSGPSLCSALTQGLTEAGVDVIDIGMVPTPLLYFATEALDTPSGIIITGSHNPTHYNGLKIMIGGVTLYGEAIQALYHFIQEKKPKNSQKKGNVIFDTSVETRYRESVLEKIRLEKPLKIVVDAGNGVTGQAAPELYRALGCEVIPLFCEIDGRFPNHHPDPGQPENLKNLQEVVLEHHADLGLAFDGDGDRLGVVDNEGKIIWPDRLLILFARDILARNPNAYILYDVKCTQNLAKDITEHNGTPLMCQTGHSLIKAKMKETGALLGGEMSGHFFFKERWNGFDDGLYAGARLLELLANSFQPQTAAEVLSSLPNSINTPELMIPISEAEKHSFVSRLISIACFKDATISTLDGLRVDFQDGFGLVRASNTSPNLILRFEGKTMEALQRIQTEFRALFQTLSPDWILPF